MKWPRMRTVIVLILLGAVLNVIVAWSCAIWSPLNERDIQQPTAWIRAVPASWPSRPDGGNVLRGFGITRFVGGALAPVQGRTSTRFFLREQSAVLAGFPLRCLVAEKSTADDSQYDLDPIDHFFSRTFYGLATLPELTEESPIPDWLPFRRAAVGYEVLPTRPIWLSILANSVFYATVLCLPTVTAFQVRRWVREKRNRCPNCGYPIGVSPVCTECGQPVVITAVGGKP